MPGLQMQVTEALTAARLQYTVLECDADFADTAVFCERYGFRLEQSANAIIVAGKASPTVYACSIVLATTKLDVNKAVCKALGVKRASFASAGTTQELSGMEIGGVTPFGLPDTIPVLIDAAVLTQDSVVMGGGNRTSKVVIDPSQFKRVPKWQIIEHLAKPKEV